jgi:hypothetical protein
VPTKEREIIKAVELPGHEPYFLLMKSTTLRKHKRARHSIYKGEDLLRFSEIVFKIFLEY